MENSAFESIYIAISTFVFIAAISAAIVLMTTIQDTAEIAIEKINNLDRTVITRPLEYNSQTGQNESNITDVTIVKGHEIIATYAESIKKNWVNKNYEFQVFDKLKGFIPLDVNSVKEINSNANYKRTVEPKVKLINHDKGYEIEKIVIKFKLEE